MDLSYCLTRALSDNFVTLVTLYQEYFEHGMSDELDFKCRNLGTVSDQIIEEIQKAETKLIRSDNWFKNLMR